MRQTQAVSEPAIEGRPTGLLIVVSGPTASGKTTVGHELAVRLDRAIHIDGDFIQGLIVTGSITMDVPPPPGALDQLRMRFRAALTVANLYRDAGFDAIISDNLFEEEAQRFIVSALQSHVPKLVHFVMLNPSVDAIWTRYNQRPGGGYTAALTPEILRAGVERTPRFGLWLDTTDQAAAQTADDILGRMREARVTYADLSAASEDGQVGEVAAR